jgi:hypothetical protein
MPAEAADFHVEQYKALRAEIQWMLKDYHALERNVAIVCGGVLAWLFAQKWNETWTIRNLGWFIPFLLACLGSVRAVGMFKAFNIYRQYFKKIEGAFKLQPLEGWDNFLDAMPNDGETKDRQLGTSKFAIVFWMSLDLVTGAIALSFGLHLAKYS